MKRIHNLFIFLSFFLPFILYFKTMAPTVSLWDCGEFIATSIIMGIPHPPGTPLYLIIGNFFSQIPILSDLGARVNIISPIASALSIMFLYMIIVYLIEKFNKEKKIQTYYAAFIGSLTFAVTDSHWFNAVEAEVYALSTLFTALVVWLILKWERENNQNTQTKYLILIFYCIGLAIGIHLLNLLAIPFIALIIFFKYFPKNKINLYKIVILGMSTGLCFLIIYKGIIKGLPSIINKTQNPIILYIFFAAIIISTIIVNIQLARKNNLIKHIAISIFSFMMLFITLNELVVTNYLDDIKNTKMMMAYELKMVNHEFDSKIQSVNNLEAKQYWEARLNEIDKQVKTEIENLEKEINLFQNNGTTYIGLLAKQSTWTIFQLLIVLTIAMILLSYFYQKNNNHYYSLSQLIVNCMFMVLLGYSTYGLIFIRAQQNPQINYNNPKDIKSAYEYINREQYGHWSILDRKGRLWDNNFSQQNPYQSWRRYTRAQEPNNITNEDVVRFVWDYQIKEMYLRYFAWQFIGKEQFDQKTWTRNSIDNEYFGMKPLQGVNLWRYGIPLAFLIGMFGIYYHFRRDQLSMFAVLNLFILTGLAIVVYLNQGDPQPRERDYAYVGSFFAFSIWIGIGIYGIIELIKEKIKFESIDHNKIHISALLLFVLIPLNMTIQDYYEHDRSQRYEAWDYAYNLLNSCDQNGILFTNGDNDTFPLWYLQYVEKVRTDVKVVNLSLLNFPSYIKQLDEHAPSLKLFESNNEYLMAVESNDRGVSLVDLAENKWFEKNATGELNGKVKLITSKGTQFNWDFLDAGYGLGYTYLTIMEIIEKCFDHRPIYFSVTTGNNQLGLDDYLVQEGLVLKLTNTKNIPLRQRTMDLGKTLELINNTYQYRNLNESNVFYGPNIERIAMVYRNVFFEAANYMALTLSENNIETSHTIIKMLNEYIPYTVVPDMLEGLKEQRMADYYQTIINYCLYIHNQEGEIPKSSILYIKENMPDLYTRYIEPLSKELIK